MKPIRTIATCLLAGCLRMAAETVIITTVSDETRHIEPLTSLGGIPLDGTARIRIGAFPGLSDDEVLDLAAEGGLARVSGSFHSFGADSAIGQGVDGAAGGFEISVNADVSPVLNGEAVSLLLETPAGEFLVARFPGRFFETQTATGLEPFLSLHLADASLIAGTRVGQAKLATSPAPAVGSFSAWLAGFPSIAEPELRLPGADADGDGRSNFLEYATGGDPAAAGDPPVCEIVPDDAGRMWFRFRRLPGLGTVRYTPQFSLNLQNTWSEASLPIEQDPGNPEVLRMRIDDPMAASGFFRLQVED